MRGFALVFTVGVVGMGMPGLDDTISPSSSLSIGCHPPLLLDRVLTCSMADSYPQTHILN
ncbi:hypothetical protein PILCRDRAFT_891 [Piloderma croceum F 1598]|uniref:Uncharacterized protein n=1 Tax=Piloderma croceum (strain F 1598) TaxID=765440 RepID=A0A0C3GMM6_PILCF|nr:hypothetical protein PILCRDRAFT_891 [Piloderma croceum F 1598]